MPGKSPTRELDQFRYEIDAMRPEQEATLRRPRNEILEQEPIRASHIQEIAATMNRIHEAVAGLLPPLGTTVAARLLVGVRRICQIIFGDRFTDSLEIHIARRLAIQ